MNGHREHRRLDGPARAGSGRLSGLRVALLTALATTLLASAFGAPPPEVAARPATAADCQSLLHQFDVAITAHRGASHADDAQQSRDLGEAACTQGHYGDGVLKIRHALHEIGVKPVKVVTAPAPR